MKVDLQKTLQQLDKQDFGKSTIEFNLVTTIQNLRNKPLIDFTIEDLRVIIGQNFNLEILIPIALEKLEQNILAEGDLYEGDLLKTVLESDSLYWNAHREQWAKLKNLYAENSLIFEANNTYKQIRNSFGCFENI